MSACCVPAVARVVSEIGARLSPNAAPETIAPTMNSGAAPTMIPTGNRIGITMMLVPTEVPVDIEITHAIRNEAAANAPPVRPALVI